MSDGNGPMMNRLQKYGPWALITGASSGLGAAFARQLSAEGINVVLVARRENRLRELASELEQNSSVKSLVVVADLTGHDFLTRLAKATVGLEIGLLVNNAGIAFDNDFLTNPIQSELDLLHLNARAPLILAHYYGKLMKEQGHGGIVFVSSVVSLVGIPAWSNYAATKAHNLLCAEGLAEELKHDGVDVLTLSPAFMRTELMRFTSFGRLLSLEPKVVARATLASLGKKRRVTPGLINKLISFSTRFQPRFLNTWVFRAVISWAQGAS